MLALIAFLKVYKTMRKEPNVYYTYAYIYIGPSNKYFVLNERVKHINMNFFFVVDID